MKHLIGKSCKITIEVKKQNLFYTVKQVTNVTDTHITFIDKFNELFSYRLKDIIEVHDVK